MNHLILGLSVDWNVQMDCKLVKGEPNATFLSCSEAHPERFNSRLRNKMFYGQCGGKDLLLRKWKDLSDFVTMECDGKDITPKLRSEKVHAVLILNIPSYGGGTRPWSGTAATDDGMIEVVGLTTYTLVTWYLLYNSVLMHHHLVG